MYSVSSKSLAGPLLSITHGRDGAELALEILPQNLSMRAPWASYLKNRRPLPIDFCIKHAHIRRFCGARPVNVIKQNLSIKINIFFISTLKKDLKVLK